MSKESTPHHSCFPQHHSPSLYPRTLCPHHSALQERPFPRHSFLSWQHSLHGCASPLKPLGNILPRAAGPGLTLPLTTTLHLNTVTSSIPLSAPPLFPHLSKWRDQSPRWKPNTGESLLAPSPSPACKGNLEAKLTHSTPETRPLHLHTVDGYFSTGSNAALSPNSLRHQPALKRNAFSFWYY